MAVRGANKSIHLQWIMRCLLRREAMSVRHFSRSVGENSRSQIHYCVQFCLIVYHVLRANFSWMCDTVVAGACQSSVKAARNCRTACQADGNLCSLCKSTLECRRAEQIRVRVDKCKRRHFSEPVVGRIQRPLLPPEGLKTIPRVHDNCVHLCRIVQIQCF